MGGEVVEEEIPIEGSWTPTLVIGTILFVAWISYGEGDFPVRVRRWCKLQKLHWRKKLGYRDESKYKMKPGDGANLKYKRQG